MLSADTHTAALVEKIRFFKKYEYKQKGERKGGQSVSKKLFTAMQATQKHGHAASTKICAYTTKVR